MVDEEPNLPEADAGNPLAREDLAILLLLGAVQSADDQSAPTLVETLLKLQKDIETETSKYLLEEKKRLELLAQ